MQAKDATFIILIAALGAFILFQQNSIHKSVPIALQSASQETTIPQSPWYVPKKFALDSMQIGLTNDQLEQHVTLYEGYVKKRNQITHDLQDVNRSEHNRTYTPFRELKVEETYAVNGQLLHELYFENMGSANRKIGPQMRQLIEQNFGSIQNYKEDLLATAGCARGWAITAYGLDDGRLHNYLLEEHNENVPVLAIPLVVLDVYEHAYMIDFGIKRDPYLELFWNHINWQAVEARIDKWVNKLQ